MCPGGSAHHSPTPVVKPAVTCGWAVISVSVALRPARLGWGLSLQTLGGAVDTANACHTQSASIKHRTESMVTKS